jgi:carbon monoxide dehydrogenase subunit G
MDITGEFRIEAPRERVWRGLNDTEVLRQCIPGCREIERLSETELEASVVLKVGPVKAPFKGKVTLSDLDPPTSYRISGEGKGGVAGFARGEALVSLADADGNATLLTYSATATVGGKLAQVGQRLLDATAGKLAADFFGKFAEAIAELGDEDEEAAPPTAPEGDQAVSEAAASGLPTWAWVSGVLVVIAGLLAFFGTRGN